MRIVIAGAGIAGLTTALSLHAAGLDDVVVLESAAEIRPLGVGINLLPHAVRELTELGLGDAVGAAGLRTGALSYRNRFGQEIWTEPRGRAAGYEWPQMSVHRGRLLLLLLDAVRERLGDDCVQVAARVNGFEVVDGGVQVSCGSADGRVSGEVLIGADGIHSKVRAQLVPDEGPPPWSGALLWRGTTWVPPYLDGRTMVMAGHASQKFVCYPLTEPGTDPRGQLLNWIAELRSSDGQNAPASWNDQVAAAVPLEHFADWTFPWLDVPGVIAGAEAVFEYPMVDRDPLDRWSYGSVTLVGDAAHAMYPIGSNGASQAILDARVLARELALAGGVEDALVAYETARRPLTAALQQANRKQGPEQVMTVVHERAPDGFEDLHSVISRQELEETAASYKRLAGFHPADLTERPSYSVARSSAGDLEPWLEVLVEVGEPVEQVDGSRVVPILRGRARGGFAGPIGSGEDRQFVTADGSVSIDATFAVRLTDGSKCTVRTTGERAQGAETFDLDVEVTSAEGVARGRAQARKVGTTVAWSAIRS